jgi:hypothetical protein
MFTLFCKIRSDKYTDSNQTLIMLVHINNDIMSIKLNTKKIPFFIEPFLCIMILLILAFGFEKSLLDTCLFWKWTPQEGLVMVLIYVDDILIAAPSEQLANEFKAHLQREFKITDCGPVQRYYY